MTTLVLRQCVIFFLLLLIVSCTTTPKRQAPVNPRPPAETIDQVVEAWDVQRGRYVPIGELVKRAAENDFLLLGETHDNPLHHLIQARLLEQIGKRRRIRAVGFEQIPANLQSRIDALPFHSPVSAVAEAVAWQESGWPSFAMYAPVFTAAIEAGAKILGADLPREKLMDLRKSGLAAFDTAEQRELGLDRALPREARESLAAEIRESHCGYASAALVEKMSDLQRARDAYMADRLLSVSEPMAALITGRGHIDNDRGVPFYLRNRRPGARVLTIGILERKTTPQRPVDLPYDFVIVTLTPEREDPCVTFRRQLERMKKQNPPVTP